MMKLEKEQLDFFKREGYLLVPGLLSEQQVKETREKIVSFLSSGKWKSSPFNTEKIISNVFTSFPELIPLTLSEKVISVVSQLLGEPPLLLPESAIHYDFYTGWHKDTTTQEREDHHFHKNKEALMLEAGFYLQDNDEHGGGLTVMSGSHLSPDPFLLPAVKPTFSSRLRNKLLGTTEEKNKTLNPFGHPIINIPSKAGDLVIFDFRLNHRATLTSRKLRAAVPPDKKKLAVFNPFSRDNEPAREYLQYILSRPEPYYQHIRNRPKEENLLTHARQLNFKLI